MLASFEPALLVAMRKAGAIAAIQRIFLDPSTADYTEKRVLGQAIGAAWTNGPPGKTITIFFANGIERVFTGCVNLIATETDITFIDGTGTAVHFKWANIAGMGVKD